MLDLAHGKRFLPHRAATNPARLASIVLVVAMIGTACSSESVAPASSATGGADIQVLGAASTASPSAAAEFSYTFQVKNVGPEDASAVTFTDVLPAGTGYNFATLNGSAAACSMASMSVSCVVGALAKGTQATIVVDLNAPVSAGSFSNTATATSAISDPQTGNNSVTVAVRVDNPLASCASPAGERTQVGLVMSKSTNTAGLFENFAFSVGSVTYTVLTNFYDGSRPLSKVVNLDCKQSPVQFVQVANYVNVTGVVGSETLPGASGPTPVIHASLVQVLTHKDR